MSDNPSVGQDVVQLAQQFRRALERRDAAAMQQIVNTYTALYVRLQDKIDLLVAQIVELGDDVSWGQISRLERYRDLMAQVAIELNRFESYLTLQVQTVSNQALQAGSANARSLVGAWVGDDRIFMQNWNALPVSAIETATGFLSTDGALYQRIAGLSATVADGVSEAIRVGIGLGRNPRTIAREITNSLGMGLTDALRTTRTVQIWSYREAARASYIANSDVVRGWYWMSALADETCLSCIAMHGTFHELDETLDDHYNGLCTPVPALIGAPDPLTKGEDWFAGLPESQQRGIMGDSIFEAYQNNQFQFGDLTTQRDDAVYGTMRTQTTLTDLVGE